MPRARTGNRFAIQRELFAVELQFRRVPWLEPQGPTNVSPAEEYCRQLKESIRLLALPAQHNSRTPVEADVNRARPGVIRKVALQSYHAGHWIDMCLVQHRAVDEIGRASCRE